VSESTPVSWTEQTWTPEHLAELYRRWDAAVGTMRPAFCVGRESLSRRVRAKMAVRRAINRLGYWLCHSGHSGAAYRMWRVLRMIR
jgi:hypothetical protein